ncbi:MFS transporter [Phytopseudomonas flavescens]|nr:MFS transporter [Pseudomonas flavescens]
MANPYLELFAAPGSKGFVLAGLVARIPLPMTGIGIITMLAQLRGSYALAGAVAASFVLAYALLSPQISRLVDRHGQSRVLSGAAATCIAGLALLLVATWLQMHDAVLFIGALMAGAMPSISAMIRARWTAIYRGQAQLQTAFSLETVLDEVTFVVGPPLSIGLSVAVFPQAGLMAGILLLGIGVFALVVQRASEPPSKTGDTADARSSAVIHLPDVRLLTLLMVGLGVIVGTVDIVSVAFADQAGNPAAASLVLSAYAVGSCLAGLLFGALRSSTPMHRLLFIGGSATALTTLPLLLVDSIPTLAASVFVAGLFFAPTMIVAMSLIERAVPESQLTEGMTWLLAGLNVGVAAGAFASGQVVDLTQASAGFGVALCGAAVVFLSALLAYRRVAQASLARASCSSSGTPIR